LAKEGISKEVPDSREKLESRRIWKVMGKKKPVIKITGAITLT